MRLIRSVSCTRLSMLMCIAMLSLALIACGGGSGSGSSTSGGGNGGGGTTSQTEILYVASGSNGQGEILAYTVNPNSGLSTPVSINGPSHVYEMHIDPTGKFLYASDFDLGAVHVYSINPSTGAITEITGSPFTASQAPGNGGPLAASPDGKFVFYSNAFGAVATFTVSSGVLTPTANVVNVPGQPSAMVVDPTSKFLYLANHADYFVGAGQFSVFAIDATTGGLTQVPGSPFSFQTNSEPSGIVMNSSGNFLYTALSNSSAVGGVSVNTTTGALTLISGAPWATGSFLPDYIAIAPSGAFLYVSQQGSGGVNAFSIDQTSGALTLVQTLDGGNPSQIVVSPSGKFLYASDTAFHGVSTYAIDQSSGNLGQPSDVPAGDDPGAIAIVQLP
jgi:6-phosphogluconolactonase